MYKKYENLLFQFRTITLAVLLILGGLPIVFFGLNRPIKIIINDSEEIIFSRYFTVAAILNQINFFPDANDEIIPGPDETLGWKATIRIRTSSQVYLSIGSTTVNFPSFEKVPFNILMQAGILPQPGDKVFMNGVEIPVDIPLPDSRLVTLQYRPGIPMSVDFEGQVEYINTAEFDLASTLWEAGYILTKSEMQSLDLSNAALIDQNVVLSRAKNLTITTPDGIFTTSAAGLTVGQALTHAGFSLQGLDYSIPPEDEFIPEDGNIEVIRVREDIQLEQNAIPYSSEYVADNELELDQESIIEAGQYGLQVSQVRIRYENGEEVSRTTEAEWTAVEPQDQIIGYGTKVVVHTLDTADGTIEYWKASQVYATSYSPCRLGVDYCNDVTASGMTLQKGVIGVQCTYFSALRGLRLYVPGYGIGVIGDCGGGLDGKFLIDLGYSDDDYVGWHQDITVYFLTPVPDTIPWMLP